MKIVILSLFLFSGLFGEEINFVALDARTGSVVRKIGPSCDQRFTPCSTFKIALSLMGYDVHILETEEKPVWPYDGVQVPLVEHAAAHSPKTWMALSVVWYSKLLAKKIGRERVQRYVSLFSYGNQDISGETGQEDGFIAAHLCSSLKISPNEQVDFLRKFFLHTLPVSSYAMEMTKRLLIQRTLENGWHLCGKPGSGFHGNKQDKIAWYVGWAEKGKRAFIFAFLLRNCELFPSWAVRQELVGEFLKDLE